jgi:hypothetical protein
MDDFYIKATFNTLSRNKDSFNTGDSAISALPIYAIYRQSRYLKFIENSDMV